MANVLDEIVRNRRNTKAAKRLLIRLMKKQGYPPKHIVTDKLRSYGAAGRQSMPTVEHRSNKEQSRRKFTFATANRERQMQRVRSPGALQRFTGVFSLVRYLFVPPRSKPSAITRHLHRLRAIANWMGRDPHRCLTHTSCRKRISRI
jgi:putative transposase